MKKNTGSFFPFTVYITMINEAENALFFSNKQHARQPFRSCHCSHITHVNWAINGNDDDDDDDDDDDGDNDDQCAVYIMYTVSEKLDRYD